MILSLFLFKKTVFIVKWERMNEGEKMYYPKQIPYLLDEDFQEHFEYSEYRIKEIENSCICLWRMKTKKTSDRRLYNYILPDACIDLVFDFKQQTICFAGFSKETEPFLLNHEIDYLGVRLRPGVFFSFFHLEANQVMDQSFPFELIEKEIDLRKIFLMSDPFQQFRFLEDYLVNKEKASKQKGMIDFVDRLWEDPNEKRVELLAEKMGIDQRQLYRLFMIHYGVSPKVLLNILRLHLCLDQLLNNPISLKEIAIQCGFYDQAHFIKEIKRYTGFSPVRLLEVYRKSCPIFTRLQNHHKL